MGSSSMYQNEWNKLEIQKRFMESRVAKFKSDDRRLVAEVST